MTRFAAMIAEMPARVWIFWLLFLVRGAFYSTMLPLWEGWDEYAHFAFLQHWNDKGTLPLQNDSISREIDESMRLTPLARELRWIGAPYLTEDEWWKLPVAERDSRLRQLAALPPSLAHQAAVPIPPHPAFTFYEAQQPPLYYWLAAAALRPVENRPLKERVRWIRLLSVLLTSFVIPLTYLAARATLGEGALAIAAAGLLAVAPELAIDAAHVANDGLTIALAAAFLWLLTREKTHWIVMGAVLGLALLSKATLLILLPILFLLRVWREPRRTALSLALALIIGGWWYARNLLIGAPLSGWLESAPLPVLISSAAQLLRTRGWVIGLYTIAKSFTWFGGWSFLTLRAWMYLPLWALGTAGLLASAAFHKREKLRDVCVFLLCFLAAMGAGEAAYFAAQKIPGLPGWYLWPAGGALAILVAAGLGRFTTVLAALLTAADLFGAAALMMPYYAGFTTWNHAAIANMGETMTRLNVPAGLFAAWILATAAIPALMMRHPARSNSTG